MKNVWIILLSIFVGVLLNTMLTRSCQSPAKEPEVKIERDTTIIVQIDTQYFPKPVPYKVEVKDTVYLPNNESDESDYQNKHAQDTSFLQEVKEYKDSTYYARISGINAFLEEIRVYPRITTQYITQTEYVRERPRKWVIYANADYMYSTKDFQTLPISMGLSYTPKKAEFHIECGKELINGVEFLKVGTKIPLILF